MNFSNDQIQQLHQRLLETRVTVPGNRGAWLGGRGKTRFPRFNSRPRQAMRQRLVQLAVETVSEGEGLRKSETVYSRVKSALRVEAEDWLRVHRSGDPVLDPENRFLGCAVVAQPTNGTRCL